MVAFTPMLIIRAVQWVFWVILLGLSAYLVSQEPFLDVGSSAADDYTLFAAIWTFLALIPLTLTTFNIGPPSGPSPLLSQPVIALVLEALTLIFWFASFIAVAVYVDNTYWVGPEGANIVNCERAVAVFGAFEWVTFCASLALTARAFGKERHKPATTAPSTV